MSTATPNATTATAKDTSTADANADIAMLERRLGLLSECSGDGDELWWW